MALQADSSAIVADMAGCCAAGKEGASAEDSVEGIAAQSDMAEGLVAFFPTRPPHHSEFCPITHCHSLI